MDLGFTPGEVIVVTGAGSGIGRACAVHAAELGLTVAAWDLSEHAVQETARTIEQAGGSCTPLVADVGDDEQVTEAMVASSKLGVLGFLVNNAGPAATSELGFEEALALCVGSMRRTLGHFVNQAEGGRPLPVVNLTSVAGNKVGTASDWYTASKAAIAGWTRHLAAYRSDDVRANAIAPGMVDTPRLAGFAESEKGQQVLARIPLGRMATPDDIAWTALFLLSPLGGYINGETIFVDGGWTVTQ